MSEPLEAPKDRSRRELLKAALQLGTVSIGAAGLVGCEDSQAADRSGSSPGAPSLPSTPTTTGPFGAFRVDVHCHHIPDFYRLALAQHGVVTAGGIPIPPWSPELAVAFMNQYGIQMQVVSISEPGVTFLPTAAERLALAQRINDYTQNEMVNSSNPLLAGRFGSFAVLPLGDPNDPLDVLNACAEATRAIQQLGMDGIGILSNYRGIYLGDPRLAPLMATLDSLGAMVFVHPVTPPAVPDTLLSKITFLYEFTFDTTRAAVSMLYNGVYRSYPNIRWLLAHAGGTIPFLAYRTSLLTLFPALAQNLGLPDVNGLNALGSYAGLYYDTALSPEATAMKSVRALTDVSHILFATDWPFSAPVFVVPGDPAPQLDDSFDAAERRRVERGNALAQFPRIRALLGS